MAQVGASTTAHAAPEVDPALAAARLRLTAWGSWQRSIPMPEAMRALAPSPGFSSAADRWAVEIDDAGPVRLGFDQELAQATDRILARVLARRFIACLTLRHVARMPSREAAKVLTREGWLCSHMTAQRWTDTAERTFADALASPWPLDL